MALSVTRSSLTPATRAVAAPGEKNLNATSAPRPGTSTARPALHSVGQALAVTPFCFAVCVAMKSISGGDKQS
jgi:hypothetical protein